MQKRIKYTDWYKKFILEVAVDLSYGGMLRWKRTNDGLSLNDFQKITGIDPVLCSKYENHEIWVPQEHRETIEEYINGAYNKQIKFLKKKGS